jgi:hypothetical protein
MRKDHGLAGCTINTKAEELIKSALKKMRCMDELASKCARKVSKRSMSRESRHTNCLISCLSMAAAHVSRQ